MVLLEVKSPPFLVALGQSIVIVLAVVAVWLLARRVLVRDDSREELLLEANDCVQSASHFREQAATHRAAGNVQAAVRAEDIADRQEKRARRLRHAANRRWWHRFTGGTRRRKRH